MVQVKSEKSYNIQILFFKIKSKEEYQSGKKLKYFKHFEIFQGQHEPCK